MPELRKQIKTLTHPRMSTDHAVCWFNQYKMDTIHVPVPAELRKGHFKTSVKHDNAGKSHPNNLSLRTPHRTLYIARSIIIVCNKYHYHNNSFTKMYTRFMIQSCPVFQTRKSSDHRHLRRYIYPSNNWFC